MPFQNADAWKWESSQPFTYSDSLTASTGMVFGVEANDAAGVWASVNPGALSASDYGNVFLEAEIQNTGAVELFVGVNQVQTSGATALPTKRWRVSPGDSYTIRGPVAKVCIWNDSDTTAGEYNLWGTLGRMANTTNASSGIYGHPGHAVSLTADSTFFTADSTYITADLTEIA